MLFGDDLGMASLPQSQTGPTPTGQLSNGLMAMCLQSQGMMVAPSQRVPPPLFSQGVAAMGPPPADDIPCSQMMEDITTQDLITPADQFDVEGDPTATGARQRSPAQLSPNRVNKRRKQDENRASLQSLPGLSPCGMPRAPTRGPAFNDGARRPAPMRIRSPPCYRSMFRTDNEDENDLKGWRAPRPAAATASQLSRFRADFKEIGMLGQGSFSKVFRARHRIDGQEYAVKRTMKEVAPVSPEFLQFIQEAQVLAHVPPHPGVVRYYSSWTEHGTSGGERLFMQLERCDDHLGIFVGTSTCMAEARLVEVARQVAGALAHLHAHGVAHMDVKPSNIYLCFPPQYHNEEGAADGGKLPPIPLGTSFKLGDFGQATRLNVGAQGVPEEACVNEGDSRYLPYEVLNSNYSCLDKADMFALGMTLYELASGLELPTGGEKYEGLRRGKLPMLPTATASFVKLLKALLNYDPAKRPSAAEVLAMAPLAKKI